jgi:hypothetical protein
VSIAKVLSSSITAWLLILVFALVLLFVAMVCVFI